MEYGRTFRAISIMIFLLGDVSIFYIIRQHRPINDIQLRSHHLRMYSLATKRKREREKKEFTAVVRSFDFTTKVKGQYPYCFLRLVNMITMLYCQLEENSTG